MRKQGVEQLVDIGLTLGGFFLGEGPRAVLVVEYIALASVVWQLVDRNGKHITWLIIQLKYGKIVVFKSINDRFHYLVLDFDDVPDLSCEVGATTVPGFSPDISMFVPSQVMVMVPLAPVPQTSTECLRRAFRTDCMG